MISKNKSLNKCPTSHECQSSKFSVQSYTFYSKYRKMISFFYNHVPYVTWDKVIYGYWEPSLNDTENNSS